MLVKPSSTITIFFLFLSVFIFYFSSLEAGFVSDDFVLVQRAANEGFYSSWGGEIGSTFFRPLTTLTYLLDYSLWGTNPVAFHITNLFWHFLVGLALFFLLSLTTKHLSLQKPYLYSFLSAVLFISLASHSESVTWVSGRTDVIATAFCLASLFYFFRQLKKPSKLYAILALFLFLIGLLAKESVIITPLLWVGLLLYDLPEDKENQKRNFKLVGVSFVIVILYSTFRFLFNNGLISGMQYGGVFNLSLPALIEHLIRHLFRALIPPLPYSFRGAVLENLYIIPLLIFAFLLFTAFWVHKKATMKQKRFLVLMVYLFCVSLIPVIGMKVSLFDSQSERLLYLPGVFATGFFTFFLFSLFKESKLALIILSSVILFQGIFLFKSNRNWVQAGKLCSEISEIVSEYDSDSIYIEAIPDNFNGAYVFRNGLNDAVEMLTGKEAVYCVNSYKKINQNTIDQSICLTVILKRDSQVIYSDELLFFDGD